MHKETFLISSQDHKPPYINTKDFDKTIHTHSLELKYLHYSEEWNIYIGSQSISHGGIY